MGHKFPLEKLGCQKKWGISRICTIPREKIPLPSVGQPRNLIGPSRTYEVVQVGSSRKTTQRKEAGLLCGCFLPKGEVLASYAYDLYVGPRPTYKSAPFRGYLVW